MKLEQQVCSLELAKRLKELGVKQESLFYFNKLKKLTRHRRASGYVHYADEGSGEVIRLVENHTNLSAFTVAELGERFPWWVSSYREPGGETPFICQMENWYESSMFREIFPDPKIFKITHTRAKTEADARAMMLIYLLENGLIVI